MKSVVTSLHSNFPSALVCFVAAVVNGPIVAGCPRRRRRSPGKVRGGGGGDPRRPVGRWTELVAGRPLADGGRALPDVGAAGADDGDSLGGGRATGHPTKAYFDGNQFCVCVPNREFQTGKYSLIFS